MADSQSLIDDLDFAARIARDGAATPLLGGPYFLLWSGLLVPTLLAHGLALRQVLPVPETMLGLLWLGYGIAGGILSGILGRRRAAAAGANTFLNRLSRISGITLSVVIFSYVIALAIAVAWGTFGHDRFNLILPFAFGVQSFHLMLLGSLSGRSYLKRAAYLAGLTMVVTLVLNSDDIIYFIAAASAVFSMMLPGFLELRGEQQPGHG